MKTIQIEDAQILSESTRSNNQFTGFLARQINRLTSRNRGSFVTEALILADLVPDKEAIRSQYLANQAAIDRYFDLVDMERLIQEFSGDVVEKIQTNAGERIKNNLPGFAVGAATGAIVLAVIVNKKQS